MLRVYSFNLSSYSIPVKGKGLIVLKKENSFVVKSSNREAVVGGGFTETYGSVMEDGRV